MPLAKRSGTARAGAFSSALLAIAVFFLFAAGEQARAQGTITVSPTVIETGTSAVITLQTSGFFDLSLVDPSDIGVRPGNGVTNLKILSASAQAMKISFDVAEAAAPGVRTFFINRNGVQVVGLDLTLRLGSHVCQPPCTPPRNCKNNSCILPPDVCQPPCAPPRKCENNRCFLPPDACDPECFSTERCQDNRCIPDPSLCDPACENPKRCQNNVCVLPGNICDPACPGGQVCSNNTCVRDPSICTPECDAACETCINNQCVDLPPVSRCDPPCIDGGHKCQCGVCIRLD